MPVTETIAAKTDLDAGVRLTRLGQLFATSDHLAHTVKTTVVSSGEPVDLTGAGVIAYFMRADDQTVVVTGTASGDTATVALPEACYAAPGRFQLIVKATLGGERKAIFWGDGTVTRSTTDAVVDPGDVIPSLEELLARIGEMERGTQAANAAAGKANTVASNADAATGRANTAAEAANAATQAADAAAKRATDAATGVEAATEAANQAAGAAGDAADAANRAAGAVGDAIAAAGEATEAANTAASRANEAAEAAEGWANAEVSSEDVGPDTPARVEVQTAEDGHKALTFYLRQGRQGDKGDTGDIGNLTINGKKPEGGRLTLTAVDVGARPDDWTPSAEDVGAVPTTRKVNEKALSSDVTLSAADVDAVPTARKVNGRALTADLDLKLDPYPVGSIYLSADATSPAALFGGEWTRIEGRFLLAADSSHAAGSAGGAASVTSGGTAITIDQMPSHRHSISPGAIRWPDPSSGQATIYWNEAAGPYVSGANLTAYVGGGKVHTHTVNTMPPYLAVYVWQRTN